jgi:chromosome segregation ATPase
LDLDDAAAEPELIPESVGEAQIEAQSYLQAVLKEIDEQEEETLQHYSSQRRGGGGTSDNEEDALSQDEAHCDQAVLAIQQEMNQMNNPTTTTPETTTTRAATATATAPPVAMSSLSSMSVASATTATTTLMVDHMPAELMSSLRRLNNAEADPSVQALFETEDRTRDTGPDIVGDEEVYDDENETAFGLVVDQTPVPRQRTFSRQSSLLVQAQDIAEDMAKDDAMDETVGDDMGGGWAAEDDDLDDDDLDIALEDTEPQVTLVDCTPALPTAGPTIPGDGQSVDVQPSQGDTVDVEEDDEKDMNQNHEFGPVVDHTPQTPAASVFSMASSVLSTANSIAAHASIMEEEFEDDDAMDETCFFGDSTIGGRTLDGAQTLDLVYEDGWDENDPIMEDEEYTTKVAPDVKEVLHVLVPGKSGEAIVDMVDYTPYGSAPARADPSVAVLAEPEDLTRDSGDGNDEVVYDDENEEEYGRVVDHTPITPIFSREASGLNSLAVHASALESDFREDDAMDETEFGDSTVGGGITLDEATDGWEQDDGVIGDEATIEDLQNGSISKEDKSSVALVDHTPSEMGSPLAKVNMDPSVVVLASKGDDDDISNGENVVFGPVVDQTPSTPAPLEFARSDSIIAQIHGHDRDNDHDTVDETTVVGGSTFGAGGSTLEVGGSTVGDGDDDSHDSVIDEGMPPGLRQLDDKLVDHVPQRPESRFGDASTLVNADPSEILSDGDDMGQEEGFFGPVVDLTPPSRPSTVLSEAASGARSTVAFAPASVAADDLDDADETVIAGEENAWEADNIDAEEARNPQSGNEEPVATRVNEQLVDFLPPQNVAPDLVSTDGREECSEVAVGGAQSLTQPEDPKEDDFGPVVDLTPAVDPSVAATGISIASTATQVTASECRALEKDDKTEGSPDDIDPLQSKVVVDHLPNMRDKRTVDSTATVKSQLSEEDEEEEDDDAKFGPVVDHLPTSRSSLAPSRGGSTVDALATVSEVDSGEADSDRDVEVDSDQAEEDGGGWDEDEDADFDVSEGGVSDRVGVQTTASLTPSTLRRSSSDNERNMSVRFEPSIGKDVSEDLSHSESEGLNETQYYDPGSASKTPQNETQYFDPESGEGSGWDDDDIVIDEPPDARNPGIPENSFTEADTPPSTPYRRPASRAQEASNVSPINDTQQQNNLHCTTCANANTSECPCVRRLINVNSEKGALIATLLTPEGESIQIDLETLLQDEIVKRRLVEEEALALHSNAKSEQLKAYHLEVEVLELRARNDSLVGKVGALEEECVGLRDEKNDLSIDLTDSRRSADELEQAKGEWSATESALRAEVSHLKQALNDSVSRVSSDADVAEQMVSMQAELASKSGRCEELAAQVSQLHDSLRQTKAQVSSQMQEMESLSSKQSKDLVALQDKLQDSQRQLRDAIRSRDMTVETVRGATKELESIRIVKDALEKQAADIMVQHEEEMEHQYHLLDKKTSEVRVLEESVQKLGGDKSSLQADLSRQRSLAEQAESLATELLSVAKERDLMQEYLIESKEAIVCLQNHIDEHGMEQEAVESKRSVEIEHLKVELNNLRETLDAKESDIDAFGAESDALVKEKDSLFQELQALQVTCRSLEAAAEHAKLLSAKAEAKATKAGEDAQSLRSELKQLSSDRGSTEVEVQRLTSRVTELESALEQAVNDAQAYASTTKDFESLVASSKMEVQSLASEKTILQAERDKVMVQLQEIEAQSSRSIALAETNSEELSRRHASASAAIQNDCDKLRLQLTEQESAVAELEQERVHLQDVTNERDILTEENEEMLVQFGMINQQMDQSDDEVRRLQSEVDELRLALSTGEGHSIEIEDLKLENDTLLLRVEEATSENLTLTSAATDLEIQYEQLEVRNRDQQDELLNLKKEIADLEQPDEALADLQERVETLDMECAEKDQIIKEHRDEMKKLREMKEKAEKIALSTHQSITQMESEAHERADQVRNLETSFDDAEAQLDATKEELARTEAALAAQEELTALEAARRGLDTHGETSSLNNRLESLGVALQSTRARLAAKEEEVEKLASELKKVQDLPSEATEVAPPVLENLPGDGSETDTGNLRSHVVSLAVALERSENRRAEAIDRLLSERQVNAESIRRLSDSVKKYYSTVSFGDM